MVILKTMLEIHPTYLPEIGNKVNLKTCKKKVNKKPDSCKCIK